MVIYVWKVMLMNDVFILSWIFKVYDDGGYKFKLYVFRNYDFDEFGSIGR